MPVTIKGVSMAVVPAHAAGDLLVAFCSADTAPSITSGWTSLGSASATWAFDGYAVAYRIADSSSTAFPFSGGTRNVRLYSLTGHDPVNPIAGSSISQGGGFGSWNSPRIVGAVGAPSLVGSANAGAVFFPPGFTDSYFFGASNNLLMGTGDFTAECWFKPQGTPQGALFEFGGQNQARMSFSGSNLMSVIASNGLTHPVSSLNAGWNHAAITRTSGTHSLWVNGFRVGSTSNGAGSGIGGTGLRIGTNWNYGDPFYGHISNLRIVSGPAIYTGDTYTVPTQPLTAVSGTALLCCNDPTNAGASSGMTVTQNSGTSGPSRDTPFTSQGTDGLRLTMLAGYGGGGNGWNISGSGSVWGVPGLTRAFSDSYIIFLEGGTSHQLRVLYQQGYHGGSLSFASVGIREAAQSSGGFFHFF